jgi:hypothetical protein
LVKDKFGNYVVQKMIEYSDDDKKNQIVNKILGSKILQKNDGYTKHVLLYIQKLGFNINSFIANSDNTNYKDNDDNVNNDVNNNINSNNITKLKKIQKSGGNNNNLNIENEGTYFNKESESYMNYINLKKNINKKEYK